MPRRILYLFMLLVIVLTACQGEATQISSSTATTAVTQPAAVSNAVQPKPTGAKAAGCTVVSQSPTPGPTEQLLFPAYIDGDQVRGPDSALVTIIEYSDFQ